MRKRNLIFPLVVSSLFMPSIEALESTTEFNSLENENNIYEAVDILIAEGGNSGGGTKTKQQQENIEKLKNKAKDAAKKRIEAKKDKVKKRSTNIDPKASFQEWSDQLFVIKDEIAALEKFLKDIQVFIDYSVKKYNQISSEYIEGDLTLVGKVLLFEYANKFEEISKRAKKLGLATNDDIKDLLKSLDSDFGKFAESSLK